MTTESEEAPSSDAEPETAEATAKPRTPEEKAAAKKLRHRAKWKLFWLVAALSLVADQVTKIWARASLPTYEAGRDPTVCADVMQTHVCSIPADISSGCCGGEAISVVDSFWHWRLSMNPGSAFGLFSGQGQAGRILLSIVGVAAVAGMIWMLKKARPDQKILHWALALVAGGAVGNLIDRIYFGVVTDFILWHWGSGTKGPNHFKNEWPVFNIADVVLVVGVGLMFIDIQKEGKREKLKKKKRQEKARAAGLVKDL